MSTTQCKGRNCKNILISIIIWILIIRKLLNYAQKFLRNFVRQNNISEERLTEGKMKLCADELGQITLNEEEMIVKKNEMPYGSSKISSRCE